MPMANAAVTLLTDYHSDPNMPWSTNDIFDIDAISYAIPYCSIVVTDKHVAHDANRSGLSGLMNTQILHDLCDLPKAI